MRQKVIAALKKIIILADFKTVHKKFVDQGIDPDTVKTYLDNFKIIRDKKDIGEYKDIDLWGKKPWEEFKNFVDKIKQEKSKTEEKKQQKTEGAELVAKNDKWLIYKILTHTAAKVYGSKTKWCITQEDGKYWRDYARTSSFYFLISRERDDSDPWYKIAVQVRKGNSFDHDSMDYWDAMDNERSELPEEIINELPNFNFTFFEKPKSDIVNTLIKYGLTDDIQDEIYEQCDMKPVKYLAEKSFLVFEEYENLKDFATTYEAKSLQWDIAILDGDEFIEPSSGSSISDMNMNNPLKLIRNKNADLFKKLINKLLKTDGFVCFIKDNYTDNKISNIEELEEELKEEEEVGNLYRIIEEYIQQDDYEVDTDLILAFQHAANDAVRSATESTLLKNMERDIRQNSYILLAEETYILDTPIYIGLPLEELSEEISEDLGGTFSDSFLKLGEDSFYWEYPTDDEIVECLINYQLPEYCAS